MTEGREGERKEYALALRGDPCLREVVLKVLDAPQRHNTFPLRRTAAERLLGLVRAVHVGIEGDLSPTFLAACRVLRRAFWWGIHDRKV